MADMELIREVLLNFSASQGSGSLVQRVFLLIFLSADNYQHANIGHMADISSNSV